MCFQGRIESETWAGVTKGAEILEEYFRKVDNSIDRVINNRDILEHEATDVRQETAQKIAHVGIGHLRNTSSSDNIQVSAYMDSFLFNTLFNILFLANCCCLLCFHYFHPLLVYFGTEQTCDKSGEN